MVTPSMTYEELQHHCVSLRKKVMALNGELGVFLEEWDWFEHNKIAGVAMIIAVNNSPHDALRKAIQKSKENQERVIQR